MLLCTNVVFMDFVCVYIYFAHAKKTSIQFRILVAEFRCRNKKKQRQQKLNHFTVHCTLPWPQVYLLSLSFDISLPFSRFHSHTAVLNALSIRTSRKIFFPFYLSTATRLLLNHRALVKQTCIQYKTLRVVSVGSGECGREGNKDMLVCPSIK